MRKRPEDTQSQMSIHHTTESTFFNSPKRNWLLRDPYNIIRKPCTFTASDGQFFTISSRLLVRGGIFLAKSWTKGCRFGGVNVGLFPRLIINLFVVDDGLFLSVMKGVIEYTNWAFLLSVNILFFFGRAKETCRHFRP